MDKNIFASIRVDNKAVTLFTIKPLDFTFPLHDQNWGFILKGRCSCITTSRECYTEEI